MPKPYKGKSMLSGCLWIVLILLGIGAQLLTMYLLHPYSEQLQGWILPIGAAPLVLAIVLGVTLDYRANKHRIRRIGEFLKSQQIEFDPEPSESIRAHVQGHLLGMSHCFGLHNDVHNIVWLAYKPDLLIFEHHYTTGSGKTLQEHNHTVVAWSAESSTPGAAIGAMPPLLVLRPRVGEGRLMFRKAGEDVELGDAEFDRCWLVYGARETADRFLNFEVRKKLLESPRGERWYIGDRWSACCFVSTLDASNLKLLIEHTKKVLGLISIS